MRREAEDVGDDDEVSLATSKRKITVGATLSWVVGLPLLLFALISVFTSPLAGMILGLTGVTTIPYSRRRIESRFNADLSRWLIVAMVVVAVPLSSTLLLGAGAAVDEPQYDVTTVKAGASAIPYDDLLRNIEEYQGESIHYVGEVSQVMEQGDDQYMMRVMVTETTYGYTDDVYVTWDGERVIEGDVVNVWGVVEGPKTYQTVLGAERTIPEITAVDITLR